MPSVHTGHVINHIDDTMFGNNVTALLCAGSKQNVWVPGQVPCGTPKARSTGSMYIINGTYYFFEIKQTNKQVNIQTKKQTNQKHALTSVLIKPICMCPLSIEVLPEIIE